MGTRLVSRAASSIVVIGSMLIAGDCVQAQYSSLASPFHTTGDGFFEHIGVGFSFNGPGFFFQQNGMGAATPPFGGFAPGAGLAGGLNFGFGGGQGQLSFAFEQGSRRSNVSTTPSVIAGNGIWGGVFDASQTPFVVGVIPVVGEAPAFTSPLAERMERLRQSPPGPSAAASTLRRAAAASNSRGAAIAAASSAERPAGSIAQMHRQREAEIAAAERTAGELAAKGERAQAAGKAGLARLYFQQAARRSSGQRRTELLQRADEANGAPSAPVDDEVAPSDR